MKSKFANFRIDKEDQKFLRDHAERNCRTVADTHRLALKEWISKEKKKGAGNK